MLIIYVTISIFSIIPTLAEFQPDISAYGADASDACKPIVSDPANKRNHIRKCRDYLLGKRKFNEASRLDLDYGLDDPIFGVEQHDIMNVINRQRLERSAEMVSSGMNPTNHYPIGTNRFTPQYDSTILLGAIEQGDLKFLKHLLESGIDPNPLKACDSTDYITVAHRKRQAEMVSMLIKYGATTSRSNDFTRGRNRLMHHVYHGDHRDVMDLLKEGVPATASIGAHTSLEMAIGRNDLQMVKILMEGGFNFEAKKMRSLHAALSSLEILEYLWPRIIHQDQVDNLFEAACMKSQDTKLIAFLLEKGAKINGNPQSKFTPLMYSIVNHRIGSELQYENPEVFHYLIGNGASIEATNRDGMTPVMMAAALKQFYFFKKLVDGGANLKTASKDSRTLRAIVESTEDGTYWNQKNALALLAGKGILRSYLSSITRFLGGYSRDTSQSTR